MPMRDPPVCGEPLAQHEPPVVKAVLPTLSARRGPTSNHVQDDNKITPCILKLNP
jgi:hypothetical protein